LNRQQFLEEFSEILGVEPGALMPETELSSLETWDSVSYLSTMVLLDEKLGVAITPDELSGAKTVQDIMNAAGSALQSA
jgi:acyl carrier protein